MTGGSSMSAEVMILGAIRPAQLRPWKSMGVIRMRQNASLFRSFRKRMQTTSIIQETFQKRQGAAHVCTSIHWRPLKKMLQYATVTDSGQLQHTSSVTKCSKFATRHSHQATTSHSRGKVFCLPGVALGVAAVAPGSQST